MDSDCDGSADEDRDITTGKETQEVSIFQHFINTLIEKVSIHCNIHLRITRDSFFTVGSEPYDFAGYTQGINLSF